MPSNARTVNPRLRLPVAALAVWAAGCGSTCDHTDLPPPPPAAVSTDPSDSGDRTSDGQTEGPSDTDTPEHTTSGVPTTRTPAPTRRATLQPGAPAEASGERFRVRLDPPATTTLPPTEGGGQTLHPAPGPAATTPP